MSLQGPLKAWSVTLNFLCAHTILLLPLQGVFNFHVTVQAGSTLRTKIAPIVKECDLGKTLPSLACALWPLSINAEKLFVLKIWVIFCGAGPRGNKRLILC